MKTLALIILVLSCAACGFTTGGWTVGSTSFLQEVNAGKRADAPMDSYSQEDKRQLASIVQHGGK
jgi:hypothetical protein